MSVQPDQSLPDDRPQDLPLVRLYADDGRDWQPVSPALARLRLQLSLGFAGVLAVVGLALGLLAWRPLLGLVAVAVLGAVWAWWLVPRQVAAISWTEDPEELVIRKGRVFRTLVSVPYGRLQFVDMESGPLARRAGIASLQMHTASPQSDAQIDGLPLEVAEALRERLTERGESQRAGL